MAIFEQQSVKKVILDDTEPLSCVIENWTNVDGHTEFVIKVQRGPFPEKSWRVYKRYNDFYKLHNYLQTSGVRLQFPPKRLIGNMDPEFISERLRNLQKYLDSVVMNPILVSSLPARSFVDPANYCQPFGELALQHVSLALRGEVGWEVIAPLEEIGWRLRKHYYQIRCKTSAKELIGGWTDYGPDKYLDDKDIHAIFKSLNQIQHPFIHSIELSLNTDIGALFVRANHKNGSLRDLICGAKPRQSFLKKYGNPKGHRPLAVQQIALYGRQILEALQFLHDKGVPYGHLHTGNIIIENDRVKLLDVENGLLGVPSFYRPFFMQHRKISSFSAIDVYCFGHTLYEMSFGNPLQGSVIDALPTCPILLKNILESILSLEACKSGLPTVETLLNETFFSCIVLGPEEKAHLKIPNSTKDRLKMAVTQMEDRLRDEQKMVRSQKRLVRVQEMMSSEEEKKKYRQKQKQEQRQMAKDQQKQKIKSEADRTNGHGRPESVSSGSASFGTATPPSVSGLSVPSPPPAPPPPPIPALGSNTPEPLRERSALLGAICNFNKSSLRSGQTVDKI